MHRSVYVAEAIAKRLEEKYGPIRTQHDELR
jgi:RNase adaptor protein for sRNA GlmZ degradation